MAKWTLSKDGVNVFVQVEKGQKIIVSKIAPSSNMQELQVYLENGTRLDVDLADYVSVSTFSKKFEECGLSRTKFCAKWKEQARKEATETTDVFSGDADLFEDDEVSESLVHSLKTTQTVSDVRSQEIDTYELGVYDVHLDNLIQPPIGFQVRAVCHEHVKTLEHSFMNNKMAQLTVLVGMTFGTPAPSYKDAGHEKVIVIGGNHSVCALKSMLHKGLCQEHVKVRLYKEMDSMTALTLGVRHNLVHEKTRPITFLENVKLLRTIRPSSRMSSSEVKKWKTDTQAIFGDTTIKSMEGRLQNHMALAKSSDEVFELVVKAEQMLNVPFTQTTFRGMLALPETLQVECLDVLLKDGLTAFRKKVKDGLVQHPKRKRNRNGKNKSETFTENESNTNDETDIITDSITIVTDEENVQMEPMEIQMKATIERLTKELNEVRQELSESNTNKKRKMGTAKEIGVGDCVNAQWKDGVMYEAVVKKVEKVFYVEFTLDGVKSKIAEDQISPVEFLE